MTTPDLPPPARRDHLWTWIGVALIVGLFVFVTVVALMVAP